MDIDGYYRSLHAEFTALRDRVRYLIGDAHWPTDGGWKESVLRAGLRRVLGSSVEVGQGFFVTDSWQSRQIDVLVWRSDAPVLFRDGNLVVVPAHAVRAVVEVKSRLNRQTLKAGLEHLAHACQNLPGRRDVVVGLFAYETSFRSSQPVLEQLRERTSDQRKIVDLVCHGPERFVRYWHTRPGTRNVYEKWHSYHLPEMAYAYFVANIIGHVAPPEFSSGGLPYYPRAGKEPHKDGDISRAGSMTERWLEMGVDFDGDRNAAGSG